MAWSMPVLKSGDANPVDSDDCLSNCKAATCGDGVVRMGLGQDAGAFEYDDGNKIDNDGCLTASWLPAVMAFCAPICSPDNQAMRLVMTETSTRTSTNALEAFCGDGSRKPTWRNAMTPTPTCATAAPTTVT